MTFQWRVRRAGALVVLFAAASYRSTVVDDPDHQRAICAPIARFPSQLRAQLLRPRVVPEKRLETKLNSMWRLLAQQISSHDTIHGLRGAQTVHSRSARADASCERSSSTRKQQFFGRGRTQARGSKRQGRGAARWDACALSRVWRGGCACSCALSSPFDVGALLQNWP